MLDISFEKDERILPEYKDMKMSGLFSDGEIRYVDIKVS